MKYVIAALFAGLTFSAASFAANNDLANSLSTAFKTMKQAEDNCPPPNHISFKPGLPAPGPLGKLSLLTATFTAKKGNLTFINNIADGICPVGTTNPRPFKSQEEHLLAEKQGATPCLVMPIPADSNSSKVLKDAEFAQNADGNYGSSENAHVHCNYKYKGIIDPDTSKPLDGFLILSSQSK
jgi:hypothetical protein